MKSPNIKIVIILITALFTILSYTVNSGTIQHSMAAGSSPDGGIYINIAVENVEADRYEAVKGEKVHFKVTLWNRGEEGERFLTMRAISGKTVLASKVVSLDWWDMDNRMVVDLFWDTASSSPGIYQVKIEIPIFADSYEFDNEFPLSKSIAVR